MSYSADTFVADEQPTTAKWNKLWSNDASFNDGTGFADNIIITRHLGSSANLQIPQGNLGLTWTNWTPTVSASGSMTITSLVVNRARYIQMGDLIVYHMDLSFTTGGTTSNSIYFSPPVNAVTPTGSSDFLPVGVATQVDGVEGWAQQNNSATQFIVRRYDGGNMAIGSGKSMRVQGTYEAA